MANSKIFSVNCLFLAAFQILFMHCIYSIGNVFESHALKGNDWEKGFGKFKKLNNIGKSLAMHSYNSLKDHEDILILVVAQGEGEGNYTTVQSAIDAVPKNNTKLTFISVRPGIYREKVNIPADKPFIILGGNDSNTTVITWNDHDGPYNSTALSATVSVDASDFNAQYITFQNSYGPGDQAVALRISGDRCAFFGCKFLGYQDTLLDDSGRHYFKECFIEGATDFICGDGQSLYDTCILHAIPEETGAITAQRRISPSEASGYAFVNCKVTGSGLVYLGRAWGPFSRVVFALTYYDDILFPQGWQNWQDSNRNKTVFYGEYQCYGPGANMTGRVPWSHNLTEAEAAPFLNKSFINGDQWLINLPFHP